MVENPPSNAGDVGLIPGQGTWIPHASEQLTRALQLSPDVVKKKKKKKLLKMKTIFWLCTLVLR